MKKFYVLVLLTVMLIASPLTEEKALELFNAIKQSEYSWGDKEAKMIVAWNFYKGKGSAKNISQAKEMLTQLAIDGNSKAKEVLKFVIRN